jgi:hypothetical protein
MSGVIWYLLVTLVAGEVFIIWCLTDLAKAIISIAEMIEAQKKEKRLT